MSFESILNFNKRFRSEENIFGLMTIGTILINYGSSVPAISVCCLLAFYYMFFSWLMFSTKEENHVWFSLISGVVYSVCLLSMAILIGKLYDGLLFLYLQIVLLIPLYGFLFTRKLWGLYKGNHYIRIVIILLLNLYILLFK